MADIRYGAKQEQRSREIEATSGRDLVARRSPRSARPTPSSIAAVLPPPARARARAARAAHDHDRRDARACRRSAPGGSACRPGTATDVGEYPLFMPMTTEQAMIGGRDTYGEPKKIGEVWARRDGDAIEAGIARMGFTVVRDPAAR